MPIKVKKRISITAKTAPSAKQQIEVFVEPINKEFLRRSSQLKQELPEQLVPVIDRSRAFFLSEIAPITLGASEGMQDAMDLVQSLFKEPVRDVISKTFSEQLILGVHIKMLTHLSEVLKMTPEEDRVFRNIFYAKHGVKIDDNAYNEKVLSAVQEVLDVQRSAERSEVHLRKVQDRRGRQHDERAASAADSGPRSKRDGRFRKST